MTWLTWRQFRGQFVTALVLLVAFVGYLLYLGYKVRHAYNTDILDCMAASGCNRSNARDDLIRKFSTLVTVPSILLMAVPAIIGIFWGTPLITRELETNTYRLVWNQSVTRARWLAVKLAFIGLVSLVVTGALSTLLTWAASRYDQLHGTRFDTLSFGSRSIAPLGYVIFAFILGTTVGLFLRRTVPAMAVTLLIVGIVQIALPIMLRPHLSPVTESVTYNATTKNRDGHLRIGQNQPLAVTGYSLPGALMLTYSSELLTASGGKVYVSQLQDCLARSNEGQQQGTPSTPDKIEQCVEQRSLHFIVTYQPANRYWPFQWLEFGAFLALAVLLSGVAFWRIRHVAG
jgi:hypothetical protein